MTCRLYLISPGLFDPMSFAKPFEQALNGGDVACFQLRLKSFEGVPASDDDIKRACDALIPIAHAHDVAFLLNDRPDLVKALGADGCHIGQEDMSCSDARHLLGEDFTIGVTCHNSRHLAMTAGEDGADYVAFGAFYDTGTKAPKSRADVEILSWWQEVTLMPCVAIGGITVENCQPLIAAGADFIAVSNGVWNYAGGPEQAVKDFNTLFDA